MRARTIVSKHADDRQPSPKKDATRFVWVEEMAADPTATCVELRVAIYIMKNYRADLGSVKVSTRQASRDLRMPRQSVQNALARLEAKGRLRRFNRPIPNTRNSAARCLLGGWATHVALPMGNAHCPQESCEELSVKRLGKKERQERTLSESRFHSGADRWRGSAPAFLRLLDEIMITLGCDENRAREIIAALPSVPS
jgi:hypothetical protein